MTDEQKNAMKIGAAYSAGYWGGAIVGLTIIGLAHSAWKRHQRKKEEKLKKKEEELQKKEGAE